MKSKVGYEARTFRVSVGIRKKDTSFYQKTWKTQLEVEELRLLE